MAELVHSLDLNLLKVFRALYETQSTTRAAERVGMSQPAVSRALAKLRASFNDPLFEWRGNKMMATAASHMLIADIGAALDSVENALHHMHRFDPRTSRSIFTLGLTDYASHAVLPQVVRHLQSVAPAVSLMIYLDGAEDAEEAVLHGRYEFAIISGPPTLVDIEGSELFTEDYVVIGDAKSIGVPGQTIPLQTYLSFPHALCSFRGTSRGWVDKRLEELGHQREVRYVFQAFSPLIANLRGTNILATVPRRLQAFARDGFGLSHWELPFASTLHRFHLITRHQGRPTPARWWFRKTLVDQLAVDGGPTGT